MIHSFAPLDPGATPRPSCPAPDASSLARSPPKVPIRKAARSSTDAGRPNPGAQSLGLHKTRYQYFLKGSETMDKNHMVSEKFTDAGQSFTYPELNKTDYPIY